MRLAWTFPVYVVILLVSMIDGESPHAECELSHALETLLFTPPNQSSVQVRALRGELFRILRAANIDPSRLQSLTELTDADKRSISSLARAGTLVKSNADKRSIATLAKNGQLPNYQNYPEDNDSDESGEVKENQRESKRTPELFVPNLTEQEQFQILLHELEDQKRNIAALARNYNYPFASKRNIASLARDYSYPRYNKRFLGALAKNGDLRAKKEDNNNNSDDRRDSKRSMVSLVRDNNLPEGVRSRNNYYDEFKRNIASLARQMGGGQGFQGKRDVIGYIVPMDEEKRSIASIKAGLGTRKKRDASDYQSDSDEGGILPVLGYDNPNIFDYEDFLLSNAGDDYPGSTGSKLGSPRQPFADDDVQFAEKRFLGSVARSGSFRSPYQSARFVPTKRHIGALARIGWLPSFRSARSRFSRSGRSDYYDRPYTSDESRTTTKIYSAYAKEPVKFVTYPTRVHAPIASAKRYFNDAVRHFGHPPHLACSGST